MLVDSENTNTNTNMSINNNTNNNNLLSEYLYQNKPNFLIKVFIEKLSEDKIDESFFLGICDIITNTSTQDKINDTLILLHLLAKAITFLSSREFLSLLRLNNTIQMENNAKRFSELLFQKKITDTAYTNCYLNLLLKTQIKDELCFHLACDLLKIVYEKHLIGKLNIEDTSELKKIFSVLSLLMFFPHYLFLDYSFLLINYLIDLNFKHILEKLDSSQVKGVSFFDYFSFSFIEEILNFNLGINKIKSENIKMCKEILSSTKEDINSIYYTRDICVLSFVFSYQNGVNSFKEKFINLISKNKSQVDDVLKSISFYQYNFYANFFIFDLLKFLEFVKKSKGGNSLILTNVEDMIVCSVAKILNYYPSLQFNQIFNYDTGVVIIRYVNKTLFVEDVIKSVKFSNKWEKLFFRNPILTSLVTIQFLMNKGNTDNTDNDISLLDQFNYNDIFVISKKFEKFDRNTAKIFIHCVTIFYLLFNNDFETFFDFLFYSKGDSNININDNMIKFNSQILRLLWDFKQKLGQDYHSVKNECEKLMNDLIIKKEDSLIYLIDNNFDEELIKFTIENIESSHISSKYFDGYIHSKDPDKVLNAFLVLGHWANTYPLQYIFTRILDVLFIFRKNVDLRLILVNEVNVNKFTKGIYLLFKAFPKLNGELLAFFNYINENVNYWISDYSLNNYTKKHLDKVKYFIEKVIVKSDYVNKNTLHIICKQDEE